MAYDQREIRGPKGAFAVCTGLSPPPNIYVRGAKLIADQRDVDDTAKIITMISGGFRRCPCQELFEVNTVLMGSRCQNHKLHRKSPLVRVRVHENEASVSS